MKHDIENSCALKMNRLTSGPAKPMLGDKNYEVHQNVIFRKFQWVEGNFLHYEGSFKKIKSTPGACKTILKL